MAVMAGVSVLTSRKGARQRGEGEGEHEGAAELGVSTPRAREAGARPLGS